MSMDDPFSAFAHHSSAVGLSLQSGTFPCYRYPMETTCDVHEPDVRDVYLRNCPCREVLDLLANKWTALAIGALEDGPRRFGELRRRLEGVSQKMLTPNLRELERDGLFTRTVYPVVPPRAGYELAAPR